MKDLATVLQEYAAYHRKTATKITHFFGVPMVIFGIMIFLGWFTIDFKPFFQVSLLLLVTFSACLYYVKLDLQLGLGVTVALVIFALIASFLTHNGLDKNNLIIFFVCFGGGWIIQLIGHFFEKRKPALLDNLGQALAAPIFLAAEIAALMKKRLDLQKHLG